MLGVLQELGKDTLSPEKELPMKNFQWRRKGSFLLNRKIGGVAEQAVGTSLVPGLRGSRRGPPAANA